MSDLYTRRSLFDDEHEAFRSSFREFLTREVVDHIEEWDDAGDIPREIWTKAGAPSRISSISPHRNRRSDGCRRWPPESSSVRSP